MIGNNNKSYISNLISKIFKTKKGRGSLGFTLIELIVAMAVFSTVVTIVSSIFVSTVGSQRKNVNQQEVLENARYVLEVMSRAIRQSTIQTSNGTSNTLTISHPEKNVVTYQLDNGQIKETSGGNTDALSTSEIFIDKLDFIVQGKGAGDSTQPRVTIVISLSNAQSGANASTIKLQTTITPRNLDSL